MLSKLTIKNVALIDYVEIDFNLGLNVMSGETGSGKSIILESLNFVLGAKADKTLIKNNQNECFVSAEFIVNGNDLIKSILNEFEIDYDDSLIISRRLTIDGKNSIKVNGSSINLTMLKKITSHLVDVHGQSEHYNLLSEANQLKLIDSFGAEEISCIKAEINEIYAKYKEINDILEKSGGDERQRELRLDVLNYQIKEIEDAEVYEGEEEELLELKSKLINEEKILNALRNSKAVISDEGGALDVLYNAVKFMSSISDLSDKYKDIFERFNSSYAELSDLEGEISSNIDSFNLSDVSLDEVMARLNLIKTLKKKYGNDYNEITSFLESARIERDNLINFDKLLSSHLKEKELLTKKLFDLHKNLNLSRITIADKFSNNVVKELKNLGMNNAKFAVKINDFPSFEDYTVSKNGPDKIEFMFSANLGENIKPLSYVISGGEMSRFMLAVKVQSSNYSDVSTYIFDEIDAGISGLTANVVAQKLYDISKNVQVIAISHLPQISVYADNNLLIEKHEDNEKTITSVKKLDENTKINELTRLLGGLTGSSTAKELALELIKNANLYKAK